MKNKLRPGEARVEFLALYEEILLMIDRGYSLMAVYRKLSGEGKITMSYYALRSNYILKISQSLKKKYSKNIADFEQKNVAAGKERQPVIIAETPKEIQTEYENGTLI